MTSRNWVRLFLSTLFIGGMTTGVVGLIVRWNEFSHLITHFQIMEILAVLFWLVGMGFIFSVISQAGFFAYLTVHRFGIGIFKSVAVWNIVQILLIIVTLFDFVFLRSQAFAEEKEEIFMYVGNAAFLFVFAAVVAYAKAKQTVKEAFIPSLFFMVVVTIIEWVPALRVNEKNWIYLMLFPLLFCNAYQILVLHKLNKRSGMSEKLTKEM
ncbi:KinB-signaling pathway activation protein [Bacillus sp. 03113]|uniref:KinB-signaling pathway activation protein n=1 Tax=Bacillus sp. 03113 TaxID=2578211 RepID=UPI00114269F4|nr:KinB-signaling pathway activation protein [Bacillus sp. 03113]